MKQLAKKNTLANSHHQPATLRARPESMGRAATASRREEDAVRKLDQDHVGVFGQEEQREGQPEYST